jgi:hypothetical protein
VVFNALEKELPATGSILKVPVVLLFNIPTVFIKFEMILIFAEELVTLEPALKPKVEVLFPKKILMPEAAVLSVISPVEDKTSKCPTLLVPEKPKSIPAPLPVDVEVNNILPAPVD